MTTVLGVGVDLRDIQIAARHTPAHRTTTRYDRAPQNLDRHPNDILAAHIAPARSPRTPQETVPMTALVE